MRLSARNVTANVGIVEEAAAGRPVRMHLGGCTYRMDADEAIGLATQLVNAVEEFKAQEREQQ